MMSPDKNRDEATESTPGAQPQPKRARRAPASAIALYVFLALSAAVALLGRKGELLPEMARMGAPIAFAVFFILFAIYRLALVRTRRYSAGKAFVQIGIGALFLLMLAPGVLNPPSKTDELESIAQLMRHADPSVRALACDAFGQQSPTEREQALSGLKALLDDPHPGVRARAQRAFDAFSAAPSVNAPTSPDPRAEGL